MKVPSKMQLSSPSSRNRRGRPIEPNLASVARAKLRSSNYLDLRAVSVERRDDELILRGVVRSFHLKQMAQSLVHMAVNGLQINNLITVVYPPGKQKKATGRS